MTKRKKFKAVICKCPECKKIIAIPTQNIIKTKKSVNILEV